MTFSGIEQECPIIQSPSLDSYESDTQRLNCSLEGKRISYKWLVKIKEWLVSS